ncbi:serine palmitoyltransferase component [Polyrhizophydium stewartii]|uniref:serine C-palmitoyltransferase n=1 Tax=Polyrhizophydium stewartii TaxID=2732419 RepID=A0ABR4N3A8_9FUNG
MGKGKRAAVARFQPPLSTTDVLSKPAPSVLLDGPSLYNSEAAAPPADEEHLIEEAPLFTLVTTYLSYFILILFGHMRDLIDSIVRPGEFRHLKAHGGYAPINSGFDTFYHRRLYTRIRDVFNRPITNVPGRTVHTLERVSNDYNKSFTLVRRHALVLTKACATISLTGNVHEVLNLSSYNYLGFAQAEGPCADAVETTVRKMGISSCSTRMEAGSLDLHDEVEALVARFLGQEDAIVFSMGFATNSTTLPSLVGKGDLILSDELNHSSLVFGSRLSGATIRVFKHNNPADLEATLRDAIAQGQPRTHRPWKKILVVIEGLYSMEGNICNLPPIIELKKKYNFYLFMDEAHSIGALGPNGRGVCDYYGIDPASIDICMGTFTKSFGAAGGYIAAKREIIDHLRMTSHASVYAEAMPIPVLQQVLTSMRIIMGEIGGDEGRHRIQTLARNSRFFASELRKMGFIVYGRDSPVIPLLLFHPAKIPAFSREMLARGIAVVVVGYPATPIITSRVRFCISAAHTMEDLEWALQQISEVGDLLGLKIAKALPAPAKVKVL